MKKNTKITQLHTTGLGEYEAWLKLYQEDPVAARVRAMGYGSEVEYWFMYENNSRNFRLEKRKMKYGVGINKKRFRRFSRAYCIMVSKGRFWIQGNDIGAVVMRPLRTGDLHNMGNVFRDILFGRFPWMRTVYNQEVSVTFNVVKDKKLNSVRKLLAHYYGVAYPTAEFIHKYIRHNFDKVLKKHRFVLEGEHKPNLNLFGFGELVYPEKGKPGVQVDFYNPVHLKHIKETNQTFRMTLLGDTIAMAAKLLLKVNLKWSVKRLKLEHDKMAKILTSMEAKMPEYCLDTKQIFHDLLKYSKDIMPNCSELELLNTNHELAYEGKRNNNCVVSYAKTVSQGSIGIFRYKEYTIEISRDAFTEELTLSQISCYSNGVAAAKDKNYIDNLIRKFNDSRPKPAITAGR